MKMLTTNTMWLMYVFYSTLIFLPENLRTNYMRGINKNAMIFISVQSFTSRKSSVRQPSSP